MTSSDRPAGPARAAAAVVNLGCRVNRVESDRITRDLAMAGVPLAGEDSADVVVINTCAVTGEAEAKTRKAVRHALGLPRAPQVVVTGCAVNLNAGELTALSPRVHAVPSKAAVAGFARGLLEGPGFAVAGRDGDAGREQLVAGSAPHAASLTDLLGRSRLGVKVQDGCNHRCSYCIVWKARGPERSVSVAEVLGQVRDACAAGVPEVVLTGVNLGAYRGEDALGRAVGIDGLLAAILDGTEIPQVRLSSVEPMDATPALVSAMAAGGDRVAPFLHLPIQSGCDETLRRMRRPYRSSDLAALADRIRAAMPAAALSADVIVGFPGETDDEFERSLVLCERMGLSRMHVFRYSKRPGTPAAEMDGQVDPRVAAERSRRMRELAARLSRADALRRIGTRERAVLEHGDEGTLASFHRVIVEGSSARGNRRAGSLLEVAIMGLDGDGVLHGEAVGERPDRIC